MIKLVCEICFERIAEVLPEVAYPLAGDMFASPDPFHGLPAPFFPEATWETMRCPICRYRPFIEDNRLLTDTGYIEVEPPVQEIVPEEVIVEDVEFVGEASKPYICPDCGKGFGARIALAGHIRSHKNI